MYPYGRTALAGQFSQAGGGRTFRRLSRLLAQVTAAPHVTQSGRGTTVSVRLTDSVLQPAKRGLSNALHVKPRAPLHGISLPAGPDCVLPNMQLLPSKTVCVTHSTLGTVN